MILRDASVVIDYLRGRDPRLSRALASLSLGVCGVTRAEVLQGARDDADQHKLLRQLNQFEAISTPEDIWDKLGRRLCELRRKGVVVPFTDALLATIALERGVELWSYDRHFSLIAAALPLRLYEPKWT